MRAFDILETIKDVSFEADLVASTPAILRGLLLRRPEISELRRFCDEGALTDDQIKDFVNGLMRDGAGEAIFPFQIALSAIAVVMEDRFSPFANEYIRDLARVRASGFSIASGVARECLAARQLRSGTLYREFPISSVVTTGGAPIVMDLCKTPHISATNDRKLAAA